MPKANDDGFQDDYASPVLQPTLAYPRHRMPVWEVTMANRIDTRFASISMALAAALFVAPASAAEISRSPFQQYLVADCFTSTCVLEFSNVPSSSRLDISNVSCVIQAASAGYVHVAQLHVVKKDGTVISAATLVPILTRDTAPYRVWSANHSVLLFATQGWHFRASVTINSSQFLACQISGYLVKLG